MTVDELLVDLQRLSHRGYGREEIQPVIQCPERLDHVIRAVEVVPSGDRAARVELFVTSPTAG